METIKEEVAKKDNKFISYLKDLPKRFFITAFSGMAQGLFVTLIAGTILAQIAGWIGDNYIGITLTHIANIAKFFMGAGIGVGIAHSLGKNKLLIFAAGVAGMIGSFADALMPGVIAPTTGVGAVLVGNNVAVPIAIIASKLVGGTPGNPIAAYVVTMLVVEVVSLYAGKTRLDIILIPIGALTLSLLGVFVAWPFIWVVNQLGTLIALATDITPFVMGIVIAVIMGILLTMPTSSAAIWVAVATPVFSGYASGDVSIEVYNAMLLAGGAATVGCACHMVGFAVASFRENGVSGLISQGIGTSMLQIPNIMQKPVIMLPMIISSAICGPLATCVFNLKCGTAGGGMGTSGLVGIFDLIKYTSNDFLGIFGIVLLMVILPAILNLVISELFRKKGWIKFGDMKLPD